MCCFLDCPGIACIIVWGLVLFGHLCIGVLTKSGWSGESQPRDCYAILLCIGSGEYGGHEMACVFLLYVGFQVSNGCSMGIFYEDYWMLEGVDMGNIYWGSSCWRGFLSIKLGILIGGFIMHYARVCTIFWEHERMCVVIIVILWFVQVTYGQGRIEIVCEDIQVGGVVFVGFRAT